MKRMTEKKNYETTDGLVQIRKKKKKERDFCSERVYVIKRRIYLFDPGVSSCSKKEKDSTDF